MDPLVDASPEWSSYNYVLGNPVADIDPDGRLPVLKLLKLAFKVVKGGVNAASLAEQFQDDINAVNTLLDGNASAGAQLGALATLAVDILSPIGVGDVKAGVKFLRRADKTKDGARAAENSADARRVARQQERRRLRRERQSRQGEGGALDQAGNPQKQSGEGFRGEERGSSGTRPGGPDKRHNRERNVGIDEEHSMRPKGGIR